MTPRMTSEIAIPVTTIGGYLGAGKTTLLNHVLSSDHGLRIAVLVNDFGSISIDDKLIASRDGDVISLANGCACCSISGDLAEALDRLARSGSRPDRILIEASGVANPARIAELANSPGLETRGTVILADAETVEARALDKFVGRLVRDQLASADLIVLNKLDLIEAGRVDRTRAWISYLAPSVPLMETIQGIISPGLMFGLLPDRRTHLGFLAGPANDDDAGQQFESHCWSTCGQVDLDVLRDVVSSLSTTLERAKGVIADARQADGAFVLQFSGKHLTIEPLAPRQTIGRTDIVLIARAGSLDRAAVSVSLDKCVDRCGNSS
jgi:G3E family GTPase